MGFGTVFGSIAFIFIFMGMIVFAVSTHRTMTVQAYERSIASERDRQQFGSTLAITTATYAVDAVVPWIDTTYADFAAGTLTGGARIIAPGTLVLNGPAHSENGSWTSPVIDTGVSGTNYTTLSWTAVLPAGTAVSLQARGGTSEAALLANDFVGPTGETTSAYTVSGTALNETVHAESRFVQYRVNLTTTNPANTPQLQSVSIGVQRFIGSTTVTVRNSGNEGLPIRETDVYLAGERVLRNKTYRVVSYESASDQVLWQPGETLTYTVFRTIATPTSVTVANGAARAAGTVS